jgi:hypothetical protein
VRRDTKALLRQAAVPAGFLAWLLSWFVLPVVVFEIGGGLGGMVAVEALIIFGPIILLVLRRGNSDSARRPRTGVPAFFFGGLFFVVGVACLVISMTQSVDDFFRQTWIAWFCLAGLFFAIGVVSARSSVATTEMRSHGEERGAALSSAARRKRRRPVSGRG